LPEANEQFNLSCPIPISDYPNILLAHGGGGKLMHQLLEKLILPSFDNAQLESRHDGAVFDIGGQRIAFTTDSYVVKPLFFPGGDIGALAVNGTVNDLAMCGARPKYMSAGLIIEEGLPVETLWRILKTMKQAANSAGISLVTGDTKVVERGKGDGIFINTAGIGLIEHDLDIRPVSVRPGDVVILSGDIGRHGMAIMASRENLSFQSKIESDCAALNSVVQNLLDEKIQIHCLRDLTRGGLATSLIEIAETSGADIVIDETKIPVRQDVAAACEILGFDPLYVANEGRFICFIPQQYMARTVEVIDKHATDTKSAAIGRVESVTTKQNGLVSMITRIGSTRLIDMLSGEQLPRIC